MATFAETPANPIPTQVPGQNAIMVGAAWYPEQWPESRWEDDLRLMEAADLRVVRIAEFAWSRMEPSEGHYDFDWLERAISLAGKHHIVTVLGTPTATPPAWLTPEISGYAASRTGWPTRDPRQSRPRLRQFCPLSRILPPHYRADGDRFGHNPNVVGWQIDNEYGYALMSYDDATRRQFQDWYRLNTRRSTVSIVIGRLPTGVRPMITGGKSHPHRGTQSWFDVGLETLRYLHLDLVPAESNRRHP